jgi:glucosamine kinase
LRDRQYFLGIDGGGSKCKARLEDAEGNLLAETVAGPANPVRDYALAIASINEACQSVYKLAGLPLGAMANTSLGMGLAGINLPHCRQAMLAWSHPFAELNLSTDLHIACLGAHGSQNGAIVIVGTGSSAMVTKDNKSFEYGGHGFLLGDKGSGAWFGAQAVRWVLESFDGLTTTSHFTHALCQFAHCYSATELAEKYLSASPAQFAQFAPLIFDFAEQQDEVALALVREGASYLSALSRQLLHHQPSRLAFIGGLAERVKPWLDADIQQQVSRALQPPECGAVLLAKQPIKSLESAS